MILEICELNYFFYQFTKQKKRNISLTNYHVAYLQVHGNYITIQFSLSVETEPSYALPSISCFFPDSILEYFQQTHIVKMVQAVIYSVQQFK